MIYGNGLKKISKKDPISATLLRTPPELMGSVYFYGKIGCLDEDTKIYIFDKRRLIKKLIKDLPEKFQVLSYNFSRKIQEIKDAEKVFSGVKECYKIMLEDKKKIVATDEHRFFNENKREIMVKDLKIGDELAGCGMHFPNSLLKNKIKSIKKIGKKMTYDISVKDNNNFFLSNGILSHNSGKTVSLLSFAGLYHDNAQRHYKIIDMWGGDRNENLYWGLPSNKKAYWDFAKKRLKLDGDGPRQYKTEYIYPLTKKFISREKFPFNPPDVTSKFFTIDLRDMITQDFPLVIGTMSQSSIGTWNNIIDECKKKDSVPRIIDKYRSEVTKKDLLYNSVLKPLSNELLFQDSLCTFNLNSREISKMLDDKETITVLCLDFIKDEYKLLVVGYFLRKICDELDKRRRKVIGLFREVSIFFRVDDKSIAPERIKVMKSYLTQWIQMGRRGLHLFLDVQSISDTRNIVGGQQDLTLFGKMPDESDRRAASEQLYRDGLITKKQITSIASLAPGQFVFSPSGGKCSTNYVLLPKCRYWEEKNGNFYNNIWQNEVGRWMGFEEEIDSLKEKREKDEETLEEEKKNRKSKSKKNISVHEVNIREPTKVDEVKEEEILKITKPSYNMYEKIQT